MIVGAILSGCMFLLPVAVTTGVLVGLDAIRQKPLFTVPPGGGFGGGPGITDRGDKIITDKYCDRSLGIYPYVARNYQQYTLNPNQWGWEEGTPGSLCMNVTTFQNGTYPTQTTAPEWSVTWQYPQGPETQPVHAFPNIKLNADSKTAIPLTVTDVTAINVEVEWYYGVGNTLPLTVDTAALTGVDANTNVAIDIFLDDDKDKSTDPEKAEFEFMVWLAAFGPATQPIGLTEGVKATQVINGVTFNLYFGQNGLGQTVLSWVVPAGTVVNNFSGDLSPLVKYDLSTLSLGSTIPYPKQSTYVGYIGLGSEALNSQQNVTLSVTKLSMEVTG